MWTGVYWAKTYWVGRYWHPVAGVIVAAVRARMVGMITNMGQLGRGADKHT